MSTGPADGDAAARADRADMERLKAGHDAALDDLMERHAAPVFHFLCRMVGNEEDANDLAQEAFVRVFKSRGTFRPEEKFSTWLFTIAANLARNHFRWRSRHPAVSLEMEAKETGQPLGETIPSGCAAPSEQALAGERDRAVRASVDRLPEDLREAVVLCEWEERSVAEAAAILDATPKAVEARLYRARRILREWLKPWLQG
ncbi:MAG: sigma-70 family RNA polymerase sigma factor [Verrucomicrobiota bacterium]|nr:sigma-70 family RNA polymerase sigma factor [Verrucomicrobiota bacterium]